jgi:GGDEF domain-containing protein
LHPLDQFRDAIPNFLPGLLTLFNLADAKRRNCHLGHHVVDDDIEEFNRLVQSSVGASGFARRVSGAAWLAIYKTQSLQSLSALLSAYHKQQDIQVGWRSTGERDGAARTVQRTVAATIVRALRCLYTTVTTSQEANGSIDELFEQYHSLPPNTPIQLSDVVNIKRNKWSCVDRYPSEMPFCPFCEGRDFEWDDGDGAIFSGSGTCRACGAYVDIKEIDHLLR